METKCSILFTETNVLKEKLTTLSAEKEKLLADSNASKRALEENINTLERERAALLEQKKNMVNQEQGQNQEDNQEAKMKELEKALDEKEEVMEEMQIEMAKVTEQLEQVR